MPTPRSILFAATIAAALATSCATRPATQTFPGIAALPAQSNLPDPLVMLNGRRVTTPEQWLHERRPELKALLQHYEYGAIPPKPAQLQVKQTGAHADFLGGQATLKLLTLETGPGQGPRIDLMLVLPKERRGPAPVFLAMNFAGNHALTTDPRVPLARSWMPSGSKGCTNNAATEAARGLQARDWPLEDIVRRGYGLAAFYSGDIDPDRAEVSQGLYAWLAQGNPANNSPTNRGTIAAWAWGFERCVDYLVTDSAVDAHRIAVVGHSRNGKAAMLAGAFDERVALVFPHQAGCGGTSPCRGKSGESVKAINTRFPHWFNAEFKQFNDAPERLPFDQHCLLALCAPRPVLFSCAEGDQWSNPAGQFDVLRAADPVYRLLGTPGISETGMPPLRQFAGQRLGYYIREGKHSMITDDWRMFMDFADQQWGK